MAKLDPQAFGTKTMSQKDVMQRAMSAGYRGAKLFGAPMKKTTPKKLKGAAKRSRAKKAATTLLGGL